MYQRTRITALLLLALLCANAHAQQPYSWPAETAVKENLQRWQNWKFGVIIHWGPYSQWGVVESWSLCPEDEDWCIRRGPYAPDYYQYKRAYENIRKEFNPVKFNPGKWAIAAKEAGMKYVVFTTKHHDGFCMFDSKYTNYKITDTGSIFSRQPNSNIVKEVFTAFRNNGLGIGAYFSKPDWHNENFWWPYFPVYDRNVNYDPLKYPDRWKQFQQYTYNQIEELLTDYGKVDLLWLDGGWVRPASSLDEETRPWLGKRQWIQDVDMPRIAAMARRLQPALLMVDRTVHGPYENYRTPEQQVPDKLLPYPWESCITLGDNWYSTGPAEKYKSVQQVVQLLVNIVARGGNLLLGVGPDKTGDLVPEVYERLKGIGAWMQVNNEAIYNTVPLAPYQDSVWRFTQNKSTAAKYAFYLPAAGENKLPASLFIPHLQPAAGSKVLLLGFTGSLGWTVKGEGIQVIIPAKVQEQLKQQPVWTFKIAATR